MKINQDFSKKKALESRGKMFKKMSKAEVSRKRGRRNKQKREKEE